MRSRFRHGAPSRADVNSLTTVVWFPDLDQSPYIVGSKKVEGAVWDGVHWTISKRQDVPSSMIHNYISVLVVCFRQSCCSAHDTILPRFDYFRCSSRSYISREINSFTSTTFVVKIRWKTTIPNVGRFLEFLLALISSKHTSLVNIVS